MINVLHFNVQSIWPSIEPPILFLFGITERHCFITQCLSPKICGFVQITAVAIYYEPG